MNSTPPPDVFVSKPFRQAIAGLNAIEARQLAQRQANRDVRLSLDQAEREDAEEAVAAAVAGKPVPRGRRTIQARDQVAEKDRESKMIDRAATRGRGAVIDAAVEHGAEEEAVIEQAMRDQHARLETCAEHYAELYRQQHDLLARKTFVERARRYGEINWAPRDDGAFLEIDRSLVRLVASAAEMLPMPQAEDLAV